MWPDVIIEQKQHVISLLAITNINIIHDFVNIKEHICKQACAIEGSTYEVTGSRIHASHQSSNPGITGQLSGPVSSQSSMTLITHHS